VNRLKGTLALQGGEEVSHNVEEAMLMSNEIVVLSQRPATVVRIVENTLPRPRSRKASEVQELVDKVYEYVS
jgi:ABC-type nitrate/sulfonate/bicarbonate transport system ATPase subunit